MRRCLWTLTRKSLSSFFLEFRINGTGIKREWQEVILKEIPSSEGSIRQKRLLLKPSCCCRWWVVAGGARTSNGSFKKHGRKPNAINAIGSRYGLRSFSILNLVFTDWSFCKNKVCIPYRKPHFNAKIVGPAKDTVTSRVGDDKPSRLKSRQSGEPGVLITEEAWGIPTMHSFYSPSCSW